MRIETADRQYEVRTLDDGIVHIREPHILPFYRCNIRFVHGRLRSLPVDNRRRRAPCAGFGLSQDGHRTRCARARRMVVFKPSAKLKERINEMPGDAGEDA